MEMRTGPGRCECAVGVSFFSIRRRHTRYWRGWSSDVCSSDLAALAGGDGFKRRRHPDQVAAQDLRHLDLRGRLVVRSAELHIHALVEAGIDVMGKLAKSCRVQIRQIHEIGTLDG